MFKCKGVQKNNIEYPYISISEDITFICGKSGSGKSTLLKMINNTVTLDKGVITYNDKNILQIDPIILRREILLLQQQLYLFKGTIKENFIQYYHYRDKKLITDEKMIEF